MARTDAPAASTLPRLRLSADAGLSARDRVVGMTGVAASVAARHDARAGGRHFPIMWAVVALPAAQSA